MQSICSPKRTLSQNRPKKGLTNSRIRMLRVDIQVILSSHVETVVMLSHKKPDSVVNGKVEFGKGEGKVPPDNIAKRAEAYNPKERATY